MAQKEEGPISIKKESVKGHETHNHVTVFGQTLQKSESWIAEMKPELNWVSNDHLYHLLRAVLHTLRDQLNVDEAAHFAAQLPLLLRGTFYECWNPQKNQPSGLTKKEFLVSVQNNLNNVKDLRFDIEVGAAVALGVIMNHISAGEMSDVVQSSKTSLKRFFNIIENFNLAQKYQ